MNSTNTKSPTVRVVVFIGLHNYCGGPRRRVVLWLLDAAPQSVVAVRIVRIALNLAMPHTRVEILRHSLAYALIGQKVGNRKLGLTEEERFEIADHVIRDLRKHGEWPELDAVVEVPIGLNRPDFITPYRHPRE